MKKKIVITGASGFIGTNLLQFYIDKGDVDILNIDIQKPRNDAHLSYWTNVDICDLTSLENAIIHFDPDYIIHLAARTDILGKTIDDYQANTVGIENIVDVSCKCPNLKKIVLASSMLVNSVGYQPKDVLDYCPPNAYGESKVKTEEIVMNSHIPCDYVIIRPTSIWGPWFDTYRNFFELISKGLYSHIGEKAVYKTYGFVGNAIIQIDGLLNADTRNLSFKERIFYIGDYYYYGLIDWANEIATVYGVKNKKIPFFIIQSAAWVGDLLQGIRIPFPMTSFRLKNMLTDNKVDLSRTQSYVPNLPYDRVTANKITIEWINSNT